MWGDVAIKNMMTSTVWCYCYDFSQVPVVLPIAALHHHCRHQYNVKGIIITIMKTVLTSQICPNMGPTNHTWQNIEEHLQTVKNLNFFLTF